MDLGTLIRILVKRWYVVVPLLALTLITAVQIGRSIDPDFQARGSVLLIGPNTAGGDEVNPLAELRSPLNTTALAIGLIAVDEQTRTEVRQLGFEGTYAVDVTPNTPIINIRVSAETPDQALLTLEAVIDAVKLKLDERQRGVEAPENSLIQGETLTKTTTARALYGSRDRAVAGIMAVGLVAAASAAVLFDAYMGRAGQAVEVEDDPAKVATLHGEAAPEPASKRSAKRQNRARRAATGKRSRGSDDEDDESAPPKELSRRQANRAQREQERALKKARKTSEKHAKEARKNIKKSTKEAHKAIENTSSLSRAERKRVRKAQREETSATTSDAVHDDELDADFDIDDNDPPESATAEGR